MDQTLKKLRIQTGVVTRTHKEKGLYEKECLQYEEKMKQTVFKDDEEEYRMKMVPQQLDETKAALRDVEIRLEKAFVTLKDLFADKELNHESKEWIAANEIIKKVEA